MPVYATIIAFDRIRDFFTLEYFYPVVADLTFCDIKFGPRISRILIPFLINRMRTAIGNRTQKVIKSLVWILASMPQVIDNSLVFQLIWRLIKRGVFVSS